jgi:hypothetical protein
MYVGFFLVLFGEFFFKSSALLLYLVTLFWSSTRLWCSLKSQC